VIRHGIAVWLRRTGAAGLLLSLSCGSPHPVRDLELAAAYPVECEGRYELSGLTLWRGRLFTVSDNIDDTIFEIQVESGSARLMAHLRFSAPPLDDFDKLDFEGITCDPDGNFYIACERPCRVLKVARDTSRIEWITPSLRPAAVKAGLMRKRNSSLEGVVWIDPGILIVCCERNERGLIRVDPATRSIHPIEAEDSPLEIPEHRDPDFCGLWNDSGRLYALVRSAHSLSELGLEGQRVVELESWSFAAIENDPHYRYHDTTYGRAEGLCMDSSRIYVILDNNGDAREDDPADRRPLLFVFKRPL